MIEQAEGRSTARKITYKDIVRALEEVEEHITRFSTKTDAIGTVVHVDWNAQKFPNAYKYTPESTHFDAELKSGGWKITKIYRSICGTCLYKLDLTENTKAHMADFVSKVRS